MPVVNENTTRKTSPKHAEVHQPGSAAKRKGGSGATLKLRKSMPRGVSKPRKLFGAYAGKVLRARPRGTGMLAALVKTAFECRKTVNEVEALDDEALLKQLDENRGSVSVEDLAADFARLYTVVKRMASLSRKAYLPPEPEHTRSPALDIRSVAKRQAEAARMALIDDGALVTSGRITEKLLVSRQALSKALKAKRMFAVEFNEARYYPVFFADGDLRRRPLEHVSKALGDIDGWEKWVFFTTSKSSLDGMTPLDALRNDVPEKVVVQAALAFAER
jgi:hypothetical protein